MDRDYIDSFIASLQRVIEKMRIEAGKLDSESLDLYRTIGELEKRVEVMRQGDE